MTNLVSVPQRVLIIDLGFLGDILHLLPALRELKRLWPGTVLDAVLTPVGAQVVQLAPNLVDRVIVYPLANPSPPWWKAFPVVTQIRRERYDLAICFTPGDRPAIATALARAGMKWLQGGSRRQLWRRWVSPHWAPDLNCRMPTFEQRAQLLKQFGLKPGPLNLAIEPGPKAEKWASDQSAGRPFFVVSPNAVSSPLNEYPLDSWRQVIASILERYSELEAWVAYTPSSPREEERARDLISLVGNARCKAAPPAPDLAHFAALLKRAMAHLGLDSGATHLATATDTPCVALFRDSPHCTNWIVPAQTRRYLRTDCSCHNGNNICQSTGPAVCMQNLDPQAVLCAFEEVIATKRESRRL